MRAKVGNCNLFTECCAITTLQFNLNKQSNEVYMCRVNTISELPIQFQLRPVKKGGGEVVNSKQTSKKSM
jgi:hypothetical protein